MKKRVEYDDTEEEEDSLSAFADEVRAFFIEETIDCEKRTRPNQNIFYKPSAKWDGGTNRNGYKYKPIWPRIAQFFIDNYLDPYTYIHAQFMIFGRITPDRLMSRQALESYEEYAQNRQQEFQTALDTQLDTFKLEVSDLSELTEWPIDDVMADVLLNDSLPLTALFRLCVAYRRKKLMSVVTTYTMRAAVQYLRGREMYDLVWGKYIPDGFKKRAETYYRDAAAS